MLKQLAARLGIGISSPRLRGMPIRTERLILRPFELSDWGSIVTYRGDVEVLKYLQQTTPIHGGTAYEFARASRQVTLNAPAYGLTLAIVRASDDELIGEVGLTRIPPHDGHYLGFLLRRTLWGRGYAAEAARAAMTFAFRELHAEKIFAGCHPENVGSRRVLEKLGMKSLPARADFPWSPAGVASLVFEADASWDPSPTAPRQNAT